MWDSKRDPDVKNRFLDSVGEDKGGMIWETALKHVYYQMWNRLSVQVRCMRQGTQGRCTGTTLRDGMGREVEAGFRMGDTCTPMADSCQCMAKPLQYCKVIQSVQSLSRVWLFATPWIAARQASLYITNSRSSLRLTSIESVLLSYNLLQYAYLLNAQSDKLWWIHIPMKL